MNELIKVNYDTEQPTVSARDLHEGLKIGTQYTIWFERMTEYGFMENINYRLVNQKRLTNNPKNPEIEIINHDISVDMAKQICMIQRTEEGKKYRQYFIDLEKAWNTPEQIMARALKMANNTIEKLKYANTELIENVNRMKPKEIFADAVTTSKMSILVGELAKILKQNNFDIGQNRLFKWLRDNGYLIKRNGTDYNMPTQYSMELGLFEIKETAITHSDGHTTINKTPKVTGKGQQYFINKFISRTP